MPRRREILAVHLLRREMRHGPAKVSMARSSGRPANVMPVRTRIGITARVDPRSSGTSRRIRRRHHPPPSRRCPPKGRGPPGSQRREPSSCPSKHAVLARISWPSRADGHPPRIRSGLSSPTATTSKRRMGSPGIRRAGHFPPRTATPDLVGTSSASRASHATGAAVAIALRGMAGIRAEEDTIAAEDVQETLQHLRESSGRGSIASTFPSPGVHVTLRNGTPGTASHGKNPRRRGHDQGQVGNRGPRRAGPGDWRSADPIGSPA